MIDFVEKYNDLITKQIFLFSNKTKNDIMLLKIAKKDTKKEINKLKLRLNKVNIDIHKISIEREEINKKIAATLQKSSKQRKKLKKLYLQRKKERLEIIDYFDFLYFSLGIATNTTFGDISANNKLVKILISLQLLVCIILLAKFLNSIFINRSKFK